MLIQNNLKKAELERKLARMQNKTRIEVLAAIKKEHPLPTITQIHLHRYYPEVLAYIHPDFRSKHTASYVEYDPNLIELYEPEVEKDDNPFL